MGSVLSSSFWLSSSITFSTPKRGSSSNSTTKDKTPVTVQKTIETGSVTSKKRTHSTLDLVIQSKSNFDHFQTQNQNRSKNAVQKMECEAKMTSKKNMKPKTSFRQSLRKAAESFLPRNTSKGRDHKVLNSNSNQACLSARQPKNGEEEIENPMQMNETDGRDLPGHMQKKRRAYSPSEMKTNKSTANNIFGNESSESKVNGAYKNSIESEHHLNHTRTKNSTSSSLARPSLENKTSDQLGSDLEILECPSHNVCTEGSPSFLRTQDTSNSCVKPKNANRSTAISSVLRPIMRKPFSLHQQQKEGVPSGDSDLNVEQVQRKNLQIISDPFRITQPLSHFDITEKKNTAYTNYLQNQMVSTGSKDGINSSHAQTQYFGNRLDQVHNTTCGPNIRMTLKDVQIHNHDIHLERSILRNDYFYQRYLCNVMKYRASVIENNRQMYWNYKQKGDLMPSFLNNINFQKSSLSNRCVENVEQSGGNVLQMKGKENISPKAFQLEPSRMSKARKCKNENSSRSVISKSNSKRLRQQKQSNRKESLKSNGKHENSVGTQSSISKKIRAFKQASSPRASVTQKQCLFKTPAQSCKPETNDTKFSPKVRTILGTKVTFVDEKRKVLVVDLIPPETCDLIREMTENHISLMEKKHGKNAKEYTWRTLYTYTKMDLPCKEVKGLASRITNHIMNDIKKIVGEIYGKRAEAMMLKPRSWKEPHLLKYQKQAGKSEHTGIEMHYDGCHITWQLMLTRLNEYQGGGTYFRCLRKNLKLDQGQVLIHPGELYHKGLDITGGLRYLIVCFMDGFDPQIMDDSDPDQDREEYERNVQTFKYSKKIKLVSKR